MKSLTFAPYGQSIGRAGDATDLQRANERAPDKYFRGGHEKMPRDFWPLRVVDFSHVDLALAVEDGGVAIGPFDGVLERRQLEERKAGNELLAFREGAV